jgi:hypothetical protein
MEALPLVLVGKEKGTRKIKGVSHVIYFTAATMF